MATRMWMTGLRQAAFMLEGDPDFRSIGIEFLATVDLPDEEEAALWGDGQNAYAFRQFLEALEQHRHFEELRFDHYRFCLADPTELDDEDDEYEESDDEGMPWEPPLEVVRLCGDDVERMFSTVLPNHPSLETLQFSGCRIHLCHLQALLAGLRPTTTTTQSASSSSAANLPRHGRALASLDFSSTELSNEGWEVVAAGIRAGARIERIRIDYGGLTQETCRLLCSAVASNPYVQELFLREQDASVVFDADCLGPILGGSATSSSIRTLTVASDRGWKGRAATDWLRLLRTCVHLESLTVAVPWSKGQFEMLLEVLRTYNFTLRPVGLGRRAKPERQQAVDSIVRRNAKIRLDYERANEHAPSLEARHLFPEAIASFNEFPTLVRRFVRQNADALGATLEPTADRAAGSVA